MGGGSDTAKQALAEAIEAGKLATASLTKIESHEKECARRWARVEKGQWFLITKGAVILSLLLAEKIGWF